MLERNRTEVKMKHQHEQSAERLFDNSINLCKFLLWKQYPNVDIKLTSEKLYNYIYLHVYNLTDKPRRMFKSLKSVAIQYLILSNRSKLNMTARFMYVSGTLGARHSNCAFLTPESIFEHLFGKGMTAANQSRS